MDDGFGDILPVCREYTLPHADPQSRVCAAIPGWTINWSSHRSSCRTTSWQSWTWNQHSISEWSRPNILGPGMMRKESICELVAYSRSSTQLHQFRTTFGASNCRRRGTLLCRSWATQHWGNSCESIPDSFPDSFRSCVLFERNLLYDGKEVENYSWLSITQQKNSFNSYLEIGHEIGAPLWSRTRNWRSSPLGYDKSQIVESIWTSRSTEGSNKTRFETCVNSQNSLMKIRSIQGHTSGNMIAPELMGHVMIRTIGKNLYSSEVVLLQFYPWNRTYCRRKRKQGGKTNHLHTCQPLWRKSWWRRTQWRSISTKQGALPQHLEIRPRCCQLGKIVSSTKSWITILANEIECSNRTRSCAGRLHLQSSLSNGDRTFSRDPNTSTSAKGDSQKQLASEAAAPKTNLSNYPMSLLQEARAKGTKILWMWRLSPTRGRHNGQNPSQIQGFDIAMICATIVQLKRTRHGDALPGNKIIGTQWTPWEEHANKMNNIPRSYSGVKMTSNAELLSWQSGGQKLTASTWITWRRSTSLTTRLITKEVVTKTLSNMKSNDSNHPSGPMGKREDWLPSNNKNVDKSLWRAR